MDLFNIVTLLISIISVMGLIYQSIILKNTINSQIYQNFVVNSLEIDRLLIEYPELRKYVYNNEPVNDKTENLDRIMSMIELITDITENIDVYNKYIPKSRKIGWMNFVRDVKKTPAYKYYINIYGNWFREE